MLYRALKGVMPVLDSSIRLRVYTAIKIVSGYNLYGRFTLSPIYLLFIVIDPLALSIFPF